MRRRFCNYADSPTPSHRHDIRRIPLQIDLPSCLSVRQYWRPSTDL